MQTENTNPDLQGVEQNVQDLTNASLIFARALGLILEEQEGIIVDISGDINLGENVKKVIVFNYQNQVHIYKCDEDLPEGSPVKMDKKEEDSSESAQ